MNIRTDKILGASLVLAAFSFITPSHVQAQTCVTPPTCESLGYTKTIANCDGHDFLKCPFDTSVGYCDSGNEDSGKCDTPVIGAFLYSDMSCSTALYENKTVIGIIFNPVHRLAIALDEGLENWALLKTDVLELPNWDDAPISDWSGKSNTLILINASIANNYSFSAAEYAYNYTTAGTKAGDWYLPAGGELQAIYDNRSVLNESLSLAGGTQLYKTYYWSSSEHNDSGAWGLTFESGDWGYDLKYGFLNGKYARYQVRPVLAF